MATATKLQSRKPSPTPGPSHGVARLTLTVNSVSYSVRPIPVEDDDLDIAYRLRKSDGTVYDVSSGRFGIACTCGDHTFRREGRTASPCKHGAALAAVGLL